MWKHCSTIPVRFSFDHDRVGHWCIPAVVPRPGWVMYEGQSDWTILMKYLRPYLSGCYGERECCCALMMLFHDSRRSPQFLLIFSMSLYHQPSMFVFHICSSYYLNWFGFGKTSLLLALTTYRTVSTMKLSQGIQRPRMVVLLLRDGIFYFVAYVTFQLVTIPKLLRLYEGCSVS